MSAASATVEALQQRIAVLAAQREAAVAAAGDDPTSPTCHLPFKTVIGGFQSEQIHKYNWFTVYLNQNCAEY